MSDQLLQDLLQTDDPAQKAALIAELALNNLTDSVALVARRCVILHWFNPELIAALQPQESEDDPQVVYGRLAALPFIQTIPHGLAYHDLTREGLIHRYSSSQPDLLQTAARLAAPIYLAREQDKLVQAEAIYCHLIAGQNDQALKLLDDHILWAGRREDWSMLLSNLAIVDEAETIPFVQPIARSAFRFFAAGLAHSNLEQREQALADFSEAIRLDPEYASAYYNRGITYDDLGQYEQALADYTEAIRLNPKYATAYHNRGYTHDNLGQYEQALADYTEAIRLNPDDPDPYNNRGITHRKLGQYEQALADYTEAIRLNPEYASAYHNRGNTYDDLGQYEQALADYAEAIRLNPKRRHHL